MEKIIHKLINEFIKGVDIYTHNGGTWLIFTDSKQWVIELTESKTLWYNYTFFKEVFEYTSMDVVENQQYITKWVENNIIKDTKDIKSDDFNVSQHLCEDVIKNGVKHTDTHRSSYISNKLLEETLQNGVKHTEIGWHQCNNVDDAIEKGVKEIYEIDWDVPTDLIEDIITDGVKDTKVCNYTDPDTQLMWVKWGHHIDEVIENGIKETKTPGEDGDLVGTLNFMAEHKINNVRKLIDNVIENGVKEIKPMDDWVNTVRIVTEVIDNGIKNPTD